MVNIKKAENPIYKPIYTRNKKGTNYDRSQAPPKYTTRAC